MVEKRRVGLARTPLTVQMVMRMMVVDSGERGCWGDTMARYLYSECLNILITKTNSRKGTLTVISEAKCAVLAP